MANRFIASLLVALSVGARSADSGGCTAGSEFEPPQCPIHLPKIKSIVVEANAAKASAETDPTVDCSSCKLSERHVRRFLRQTKRVDANDAHHTLDWSACHASGTVTFVDGSSARWSIHQLRGGTLTRDGEASIALYCRHCEFKPFL